MHLVIIDTAGIQPYIFGSNRLRENIGASYLVAQATGPWVLEAVEAACPGKHNILDIASAKLDESRSILTDPNLEAEVLYTGGGNAVILFRNEEKETKGSEKFERTLSVNVLKHAPGMQLVVEAIGFTPGKKSLKETLDELRKCLAARKRAWVPSAPLLGLGVNVACFSTGLPAAFVEQLSEDEPEHPIAAEVKAKWQAARKQAGGNPSAADERLQHFFELAVPRQVGEDVFNVGDRFIFPRELDHLGRSAGEHSYIAVVHADGNGMGDRIQELGKPFTNDDAGFIQEMRRFSKGLNEAARKALRATFDVLLACIDQQEQHITHPCTHARERVPAVQLETDERDRRHVLPFRPIVFGGDDVTFICDGRLGLPLALTYLRYFETYTDEKDEAGRHLVPGGRATARAGIAIVKAHYPFARAYDLSEQLAKEAKRLRQTLRDETDKCWDGSVLDWHFATSGLSGPIEEIRRREYHTKKGKLHQRPVTLGEQPPSVDSHRLQFWVVVEKGIETFQEDKDWSGRRSKQKALRDALREETDAVRRYRKAFMKNDLLPDVLDDPDLRDTGWKDMRCGYFDALEMADWYLPIVDQRYPRHTTGKER